MSGALTCDREDVYLRNRIVKREERKGGTLETLKESLKGGKAPSTVKVGFDPIYGGRGDNGVKYGKI